MAKGILYLVPTPIGNLDDMTFRGVEVLKTVDLIAAEDTRTSQKLLHHYQIKNKLISYHKFNESKQTKILVDLLEQGKHLAVITDAGTPGISDPASILVKTAIHQGIQVTCLPGATAVIPALAASGLDTVNFTFAGFLPAKQKDRKALLESLSKLPHTLVIYESTHHLNDTLAELSTYFGPRQAVIAKEISKLHETFYRGTLSELAQTTEIDRRGEFVLLIEGVEKQTMTDEALISLITNNLTQDLTVRELVNRISETTGISRNRIYKLVLMLKKKS